MQITTTCSHVLRRFPTGLLEVTRIFPNISVITLEACLGVRENFFKLCSEQTNVYR